MYPQRAPLSKLSRKPPRTHHQGHQVPCAKGVDQDIIKEDVKTVQSTMLFATIVTKVATLQGFVGVTDESNQQHP